jgi:hypothetical protein
LGHIQDLWASVVWPSGHAVWTVFFTKNRHIAWGAHEVQSEIEREQTHKTESKNYCNFQTEHGFLLGSELKSRDVA